MKASVSGVLLLSLVALTLFSPASVGTAMAGCAIASDGHGGYGFHYGADELEHDKHLALKACWHVTSHPDDVHIIYSTRARGFGAIVRYTLRDGRHQIATQAGHSSHHRARENAIQYALEHGAESYEVVEEWED